MQNAIILHGAPEKEYYYDVHKPSESNAHWLPWLQKELVIRDIAAETPEIPMSYEPQWELWCRYIERYPLTSDTILVGHSAGGGFWLKYLATHPSLRVGKVVLVAPWLDPGKTLAEDFFDGWDRDPAVVQRTAGLVVMISDDDSESTQQSVDAICSTIQGVTRRQFHGYGHFTYDNLGGTAFAELRDEVLSAI